MSKKTKEIINYGAIAAMFLIFLVPILLVNYSKLENNKKFHEWLREDIETCHQRAERDTVDTRWCNEIRDAASLAYTEATQANNDTLIVLFFAPFLLMLIINFVFLRKQVEELKEKIDA